MSDLFRFREVPDPDGLLEDLLGELIDNGALVEVMSAQTVEEAFEDHRKAQVIREAIAYVKAWTRVGDDEELQWADGEVLDAAEKYAEHLERRAYNGPPVSPEVPT